MTTDAAQTVLNTVGRRIRAARTEQGLNLDQLARLSGISAPALSLIETAKRDARVTTLARIAAALRVPLAALVDNTRSDDDAPSDTSPAGYDLGEYQ